MKQNSEKRLDDVYMRSFFELITCECCHTGLYKTKTMQIVDVLDLFYLIIRHNH